MQYGAASTNIEVSTDAETRHVGKPANRVFRRRHIRHQRCAGKKSVAMGQNNSVGDSSTHPKIVGVHDQAFFFHWITWFTIMGIFPPGRVIGWAARLAVTFMQGPARSATRARMSI